MALVWQIAFLMIGTNPARFRQWMILAILEKLGYVTTLAVLRLQDRISSVDVQPLAPDLLLGILFIVAFVKTRPEAASAR